jgi:zinc protease
MATEEHTHLSLALTSFPLMTNQTHLLLFSLMLFCRASFAQSGEDKNQHLHTLDNGLQVIIIEDSTIPVVHYNLVFKFGANVEDETINGVAHLYEHMMFTATKSYPDTKHYQEKLSEKGIVMNALTNEESMQLYFSMLSTHWKSGLDLFAESIINPVFLEEELKRQKAAIRDELNIFATDPYYLLGQETKKALWSNSFSRKDISGEINAIFKTTTTQLYRLQKKYHTPDRALLIVAGDVNKGEVITHIEKAFNQWQSSVTNSNSIEQFEFVPLTESKYTLLENSQIENPFIVVEWQGPGRDIKEQIAASIFLYSLNLSTSSFYKDLEEKDYVYDLFSGIRFGSKSSTIVMEFDTDTKTTDELIDWLDNQISSWLKDSPITPEELTNAKRKWEIEAIFEREMLSEHILELGDRWAIGGDPLSIFYQDAIQNITIEDINQVVGKYLDQPRSVGMVIHPDQTKKLHKTIRNKFLPK